MNRSTTANRLTTANHDRDAVGMRYVYPVISRRAGGVSVGINLNPNNACNWHCAYCQVPDLQRGVAPEIDLDLLHSELTTLLDWLLHGDFMVERVPEASRRISDLALSGNGEPTSCRDFDQVIELLCTVMQAAELQRPLRLITNGSYLQRPAVQRGLTQMAAHDGEVWLKVDAVDAAAVRRINGVSLDAHFLRARVEASVACCPTWIQTCMVAWDGEPPADAELDAYLDFLHALRRDGIALRGVLLYGLARPSQQPEAVHVAPLPQVWMEGFADRIRQLGWSVTLSI